MQQELVTITVINDRSLYVWSERGITYLDRVVLHALYKTSAEYASTRWYCNRILVNHDGGKALVAEFAAALPAAYARLYPVAVEVVAGVMLP
jgi:hypothetical protein